jgi:ABC-2 type transport system permease protein
MMKTSLIFKHELIKTLRSRSFLAVLILVPMLSFIVLIIASSLDGRKEAAATQGSPQGSAEELEILGFIDSGGLIQTVPAEMSAVIKPYPDLVSARAAVERGEITAFFSIPADYLQRGQVEVYRPDFNPIGGMESSAILTTLLNANLLRDDPDLRERIMFPYNLTFRYLSETVQPEEDSGWAFMLPYIVTFLFYIFILTSASLLLNSVTKEKENRVIEILLTSVKPVQMLTGKITALGLIGLFQTVVWMVSGWLMLRYSGRAALIPSSIQLPASVLIWGVIFFILGYAIYASLMAGIGALVTNLRESSQATILVVIPLIIPLMLVSALIEKPNSAVSLVLGLFPFTSPVAMMTRLAAAQIPIWQPFLAAILQALTAWLIIRAVAGMFRAQNLLAGQRFDLKVYLRALLGRV